MSPSACRVRTPVQPGRVRIDIGEPFVTELAMARTIAFVMAVPREAKVERHHRDAPVRGVGDGTTEIMDRIIAKGMGS